METESEDTKGQWPPKISAKFSAAIAAAQAEMGHASKDRIVEMKTRKGDIIRYPYATFASCLDAVRPAWSKNGISYTFDAEQEIREVDFETDSGQVAKRMGTMIRVSIVLYFEGECRPYRPTIFSVPSLDPKAIGSAVTYAKRYQLTGAAGIAADEDDDGAAAAEGAPEQPQPREPRNGQASAPRGGATERPDARAQRPAPAATAPREPDPAAVALYQAAVALYQEFERRLREDGTLEGQATIREQIRKSETVKKAPLIEASFMRSVELADTPDERRALAGEIQRDALGEEAKGRVHKAYLARGKAAQGTGAANA